MKSERKLTSFDKVAKRYSKDVIPYRYPQYLTMIHLLELGGSEQVLDIGSGPGIMSLELAKLIPKGYLKGGDISEPMVALASENARRLGVSNAEFMVEDALNLSFPDETFDVIISSNAFPWVSDRKKFLKEVFRTLKPGGKFGLVSLADTVYQEFADALTAIAHNYDDRIPSGPDFSVAGARVFTQQNLANFVRENGFEILRSFRFSAEEPISPEKYLNRVNSIVNENYLDDLEPDEKTQARADIIEALNQLFGDKLVITESSIFVLARRTE
ncbi:MAG: methyltransferase domain-containing protein [candidate division Zixibacteria bacterium]|nr:methyltransferase domain-containing protein [candidate division Zixibacteria bacterium]